MKRLFIILVAAVTFGWAMPQPAQASWTLVQHPRGTCNVTPCSLTVAATVAGNVGFIIYLDGAGVTRTISSVSDGSSAWVVNSSCKITNNSLGNIGAAYTLSLAGGITSITSTISGNAFNGEVEFLEYSSTLSPAVFDSCGGSSNGSSASPSGQALTLTGTSDVILQVIDSGGPQNATAITGAYTSPADFPFSGPSQGGYGIAGAINTSSGAAPTWTLNGANITIVLAIAIRETPLAAPLITSGNSATFTLGINGTFTVTATGNPTPTFSKTGSLPSAVTLSAGGVLSGVPGAGTAGTYPITITATNGVNPDATQSFTLTVVVASYLTGQIFSAPLFPQATPSAVYPPDTGYTLTAVASGANLQTAINAAACGTKLNLAHGGTFTSGSAWALPNNSCTCHTDSTKWQIIQGDQFEANYVAGVRVDPSAQYAQFPHLSNSDGNYAFTANTNGASCWGFAGLDVTETTDGATAVLSLGDGSVTVANFPHDFAVWGSSIHGQASKGVTRCMVFNGNWGAVVDSYLSDCHKVGQDSQAVEMWDGLGPLLVQNTFLEGAAENILIGGSDPQAGVIPSDFTFQKNHFFKPLSWRVADPSYAGIHWSVKNCFELKDAQRVLITGNVFENGWGDGQNGQCITWNTSNQGNTDPQAAISDINMYYNVIRHYAAVYQIGNNANLTRQPVHRIYTHDNLDWDIDPTQWASTFSGGIRNIQIGGTPPGALYAPYDIWFVHESIASASSAGLLFINTANVDLEYGFQLKDSIFPRPIFGNGTAGGDAIIPTFAPNLIATNDCMYGSDGNTYNNAAFNGKQFPANQAAIFVTPGVDYHVAPASVCHNAASDGTDMGANIDAVNAATAGVTEALANPHTVTNVSPSTFTHLGSTSITITGTNFISGAAEVIIGGAGPVAAVAVDICAVNTCDVVTSVPITLAVNDTVNMAGMNANLSDQGQFLVASVTDTTHFTYTDNGIGTRSWLGGTANRITPGNACASVVVVNSTTITCVTPAATGTVTNGPVSIFVSQWGIPVQSTVYGLYN